MIKHYIKPDLHGIALMIVSCFWAAMMVSIIRYLSKDLHALLIVFFRNFFSFILLLPWLMQSGIKTLKTKKIKLYLSRAVIGLGAMMCWFYALSLVPVSEATALSFTTPLFTALGAIFILKEKYNTARILALIVGFIGAIIILKPGFKNFDPNSLFVIATATFWAFSSMLIKTLSKTEVPQVIVFYMVSIMSVLSIPLALIFWKTPDLNQFLWLIALGFVANQFQITLSRAYAKSDLTLLMPFDFARLIFVSIIAYFAFNEIVEITSIIGTVIILLSSIYVLRHERKSRAVPIQ